MRKTSGDSRKNEHYIKNTRYKRCNSLPLWISKATNVFGDGQNLNKMHSINNKPRYSADPWKLPFELRYRLNQYPPPRHDPKSNELYFMLAAATLLVWKSPKWEEKGGRGGICCQNGKITPNFPSLNGPYGIPEGVFILLLNMPSATITG